MDTNDSINPGLEDLQQEDHDDAPAVDVRHVGPLRVHQLPSRVANSRSVTLSSTADDPTLVEVIAAEDLRRDYLAISVTGQSAYVGHDKYSVARGISGILPPGAILMLPTSEPVYARAAGASGVDLNAPGVTLSTDPGVGVNGWTVTVPAGELWELESVFFSFQTSAVVGTRTVHLVIDDGTNTLVEIAPLNAQGQGLTYKYSYRRDQPNENSTGVGNLVQMGVPPMLLGEGYRITVSSDPMDAGDNFSAGAIGYRQAGATADPALSYWTGQWAD